MAWGDDEGDGKEIVAMLCLARMGFMGARRILHRTRTMYLLRTSSGIESISLFVFRFQKGKGWEVAPASEDRHALASRQMANAHYDTCG